MDYETYTQLMRAIGRYGRLHIGDVEDIAISNAERAVFDLIGAYGDSRAAAERKRAASIASLVFVNDPYALHPDIPFDRLNESARTAAHSIAQTIAGLIMDAPD